LLNSIRVLDVAEALAGPYCAMILGDLGADVIKIERRETGDHARNWGPPFLGSESAYFLAANRNKRSLTLDYKNARGREILERLLHTADVFVINQPSLESLTRHGLDPRTLCTRYPRLIYCSITGYGLEGPRAGLPGYDLIAQAEAGAMSFTGEPGGEPMRYPIAIADVTCGLYAALGIVAGLWAREKSGQGEFLDMALFDSQLTWLMNIGSNFLNAQSVPRRWGNAHPSIVPYQLFRGADGRHFAVAIGTESQWMRLTRALGVEDTIGKDSRFTSNTLRIQHREQLIPAIQEIFNQLPAAAWLERLAKAKIPSSSVHDVSEALNDRQTLSRGLIVTIRHPQLGLVRSIANPIRFSGNPVLYRLPPPILGEHTQEILLSLGYSADDIANASQAAAI
ncbi:MAG: CoA transferase, partial [Acidobacteria bacterium]|nr:CoA transferase [Acidobacteriota bacterium]